MLIIHPIIPVEVVAVVVAGATVVVESVAEVVEGVAVVVIGVAVVVEGVKEVPEIETKSTAPVSAWSFICLSVKGMLL